MAAFVRTAVEDLRNTAAMSQSVSPCAARSRSLRTSETDQSRLVLLAVFSGGNENPELTAVILSKDGRWLAPVRGLAYAPARMRRSPPSNVS